MVHKWTHLLVLLKARWCHETTDELCQCDLQIGATRKPLDALSVGSELSAKGMATLHQGHWQCAGPRLFEGSFPEESAMLSKRWWTHMPACRRPSLLPAIQPQLTDTVDCAIVAVFSQVLPNGTKDRPASIVYLCIALHFLNRLFFVSKPFSFYGPKEKGAIWKLFHLRFSKCHRTRLEFFQSTHLPAFGLCGSLYINSIINLITINATLLIVLNFC